MVKRWIIFLALAVVGERGMADSPAGEAAKANNEPHVIVVGGGLAGDKA